jgi:galactofuranosylgalactofuranosylrhamnosyl-N-acetylglucosaminyl-diphospho-decaprenol beta-1,5/1,6-galactofuranosyltransferase
VRTSYRAPDPDLSTALLHESVLAPDGELWQDAFPASAWHRVLGRTELRVEVAGPSAGSLVLWAASGGRRVSIGPSETGRWDVTLADGGPDWYWFEPAGAASPTDAASHATVTSPAPAATSTDTRVRWTMPEPIALPRVTVVMPTYRREADATEQAVRFAAMPVVSQVLVIDQAGTLAHHAVFAATARSAMGRGKIRLLEQANLGGSGGYARGMLESLASPEDAVLLGDDDAVLPAESLRRMLTFQALAARGGTPTIVGTGMRAAEQPTQLISQAEHVRRSDFWWTSADGVGEGRDLDTAPEAWTWLARHDEPDYTGWWGTLLPPGTVSEVGLPAPFFLKWDDPEYGLRATDLGYRTEILPGASVTHPTWDAVRTQMSFSARIMHRNRLAAAAAHGAGRGVIGSSLSHQLKHVLAGHELTAQLWADGIDAFLDGPTSWLGTDLERARPDGQRIIDRYWHHQEPLVAGLRPRRTRTRPLPPTRGTIRAVLRLAGPDRRPGKVLSLPTDEVSWRSTLGADAVVMTGADGSTEHAFAVTGSSGRALLWRTLRQHLRLALRWPGLRRRYRRALPRTTTADFWRDVIGTDVIGNDALDADRDTTRRNDDGADRTSDRTDEGRQES